jgi:hypothetical protein
MPAKSAVDFSRSMSSQRKVAFSQELSSKLGVLSVLSILFVLFNHSRLDSQNGVDFESQFRGLEFVNNLVSAVTRLNRVLFFSIAGFLFAYGAPFSGGSLLEKLKNRFWTILVPYLCSLFLITLGVAFAIWHLDDDFSSRSPMLSPIAKVNGNWFHALIQIRSQAGIHLWFIESLMINVCVVGLYIKMTCWNLVAHVILLIISICGFSLTGNQYFEGLLYFLFGALLSRRVLLLEYKDKRVWILFLKSIVWGLLLVLYLQKKTLSAGFPFPIVKILQAILGASVVWQLVDFIPASLAPRFAQLSAYTFPIYLLHAPFILGLIRHGYIKVMPLTEFSYSCAWLVIAIVAYIVSYSLARVLEFAFPRLSSIVFGGRGAARKVKR